MKTAHGHLLLSLFAVAALTAFAPGCAISGKSFSIDSNSRIPFFGLELRERKPKSAAPTYNSISRTDADNSRIETAVKVASPSTRGLAKLRELNPWNSKVSGTVENGSATGMGMKNSPKAQSPLSQPLPVTDRSPVIVDSRTSVMANDFQ